ncbi:periplasmic protein [Campylobacter sputorum subsp. bubulus]|uniref:Periplasmic protein n=1 Tax=Campylobacter sputorum subsp. sputorum TaxID=32024 RepID=A0A381DH30_9BACT|nr:flagellar basal body-associated FliL family protein [Campylobacter sputorum]ASM35080.1 hypothetical protein CSPUT_0856 [Campylobacter sputorum aubsp. sputorum RM3237]KAB0581318.1 flagellar basal body-associated FliL family protein [Campylobacter sputorum subsp. sputorum]QEL05270.1 hypothetical protein CSPT_0854 [Campylobacter sputorum subsp. sputorum]SUX08930.1 periplasmic protein [Campylobacter sputorum subsp. bubulus]SUX09777.1 periplasmic protein [Campylobacter sputorum subsp. sputorum]
MKVLFCLLVFLSFSFSEGINIENFETNLYSKAGKNNIRKVSLSVELIGRDLMENKGKILDSINVIISSYFVEDIMTSKGKENFKNMVLEYARKRYNVDLEAMYIIELKTISEPSMDEIIAAIRSTDICKTMENKQPHNPPQTIQNLEQKPNQSEFYNGGNSTQSPNLKEYDITKDPNFGKDFGEN